MSKDRVPAIDGWFRPEADGSATLLGLRDTATGTAVFPREQAISRPPQADDPSFEEIELSRTGTLWSYTTNHYQPPEPYMSPDPFVPYTVCAVELDDEKMVVLGQLEHGIDPADLRVGMTMQLVTGDLYEDDDAIHTIWQWRPAPASS